MHFVTGIDFVCISAGDVRSVHPLPHACAQGRVPPGAGGADALQHAGGPHQPGPGLSARGSSQVQDTSEHTRDHNLATFPHATF